MKWKHPHISKFYEALGALADGRVIFDMSTAQVYSSSRNKAYDVVYDASSNAIMSNDNSAYYTGTLGYPAIAFLLATGVLPYKDSMGNLLKNIPWKDLNQQYKNNFDMTVSVVLGALPEEERHVLEDYVKTLDREIQSLELGMLGKRVKPPEGY